MAGIDEARNEVNSLNDLVSEIKNTFTHLGENVGIALTNLIVKGYELNKVFGQTGERIVEIQQATADALPGITRIGGTIEDVGRMMTNIAVESRRNTIATAEQMEKIYASYKVTGVEVSRLTQGFLDAGYGLNKIGKEMETAVNYVRSIGGNVGTVSKLVVDNLDLLNRFSFDKGVGGLTKMAAQASMLRFDMSRTAEFADKVMDPEGAVRMAAALQRLGVAAGNLTDPFALMNQSILDPSGLQDSIIGVAKQFTEFNKETGKFEISREGILRFRELAQETGISSAEMQKAGLAAAELDARLNQISPSIKFKSEEDKMLLANIGRLGDGGQYEVQLEPGGDYVKLSQLGQDQVNKLIEQQQTAPKNMEEIARAQMRFDEAMAADIRTIKNLISYGAASQTGILRPIQTTTEVVRAAGGAVSDMADMKGARRGFESVGDTMKQLLSDVTSGKKVDLEKYAKFFEGMTDKVENFTRDAFKAAKEAAKEKIPEDDKKWINDFLEKTGLKYDDKLKASEAAKNNVEPLANNQYIPANFVRGQQIQQTLAANGGDVNGNMTVTQKVEFTPLNINITAPPGVDKQYLTQVLNSPQFTGGITETLLKNIKEQQGGTTRPNYLYKNYG